MSDVIHATARALEIIRRRGDDAVARKAPADTRACDGMPESFMNGAFYAGAALLVLEGRDLKVEANLGYAFRDTSWPTCMECLVKLDHALEFPEPKP